MEAASPALRQHLKGLILQACDVRDVKPEEIVDEAPLFGPEGALDLTSLDAIEIAVAVERAYQVKMKNMSSARAVFASIASLSDHIAREADPAHLQRVLTGAG